MRYQAEPTPKLPSPVGQTYGNGQVVMFWAGRCRTGTEVHVCSDGSSRTYCGIWHRGYARPVKGRVTCERCLEGFPTLVEKLDAVTMGEKPAVVEESKQAESFAMKMARSTLPEVAHQEGRHDSAPANGCSMCAEKYPQAFLRSAVTPKAPAAPKAAPVELKPIITSKVLTPAQKAWATRRARALAAAR